MKLMLFLAIAIFYSFVSTNQSKYKYYFMCDETLHVHIHLENCRILTAQYQLCDSSAVKPDCSTVSSKLNFLKLTIKWGR